MAVVGKAAVLIVPKFPGFSDAVRRQLRDVDGEGPGRKVGGDYGRGMGSGLLKSGAVIGAFSAVTSKAMDTVASSVGGAISRFDTLNNYPKVMKAVGFSADSSQKSIKKMSDRLQGLPTTLNSMASTVQGIAVITKDLDKATDAGLALNDMLIAGGASQEAMSSAMEQFRQILAKGKPYMSDWQILTTAMPGQLDQLAKSMLGPTASATDLYEALGGGGHEATVSMDDLMTAMIRLDTEGGENVASFAEQAKTAAGGVETSMENTKNAVVRGLSGLMDEIGQDTIAGVFDDVRHGIDNAFGAIKPIVGGAMPIVKSFYEVVKQAGPAFLPAIAGVASLVGVSKSISGVTSLIGKFNSQMSNVKGIATKASDGLLKLAAGAKAGSKMSNGLFRASGLLSGALGGPLVIGLGAAAAAAGLLVGAFMDAKKRNDEFTKATEGLSSAVDRATNLGTYSGQIDGVGEVSGKAALSLDELTAAMGRHVDKINETAAKAEEEIAQLNTAKGIIDNYTGVTDLSSEAQGKLQWAIKLVNDQFGLGITAADVAAGKYHDLDGNVHDLKKSIDELIASKEKEIKLSALTDILTEQYKAQADAEKVLAQKKKDLSDHEAKWASELNKSQNKMDDYNVVQNRMKSELEEADKVVKTSRGNLKKTEEALGDVTKTTSESADEFDRWGSKMGGVFSAQLDIAGTSISGLKEDLRGLVDHSEENMEKLNSLTEEQLDQLAKHYDGTAASIVGDLEEWGITMSDVSKKTADGAKKIADALSGMDGVADGLSSAGINVNDFSKKLSEAGISTGKLKAVGSENLKAIAEVCHGSMDEMVFFIDNYNQTPIEEKDGVVTIDDEQLVWSQDRVWKWNGAEFVDKDTNVMVQDQQLIDSQGRVWIWDAGGKQLVKKQGSANVDGNIDEQNKQVDIFQNTNANLGTKTGYINIFKTIQETVSQAFGNAAGGIRLHADGGVRLHAHGAIATRAVKLDDIVGEDGSEAIVPLSNKSYSLPFAKTLAEQIGNYGGVTNNYRFGNITIDAHNLEDIQTVESFVNRVFREGRAR